MTRLQVAQCDDLQRRGCVDPQRRAHIASKLDSRRIATDLRLWRLILYEHQRAGGGESDAQPGERLS